MFYSQPAHGADVLISSRISQEELEFALVEHAKWLQSGGVDGRRASFKDQDLRACDLRGADLSYASLRGANLQGMDISHAIFQEADLTEANLSSVVARGCNFFRANLSGVDARFAVFCDAYMASAQCMNAHFSESDLSGATLREAVLRGGDFSAANFTRADLSLLMGRGVTFNYALFDQASMQQADMREAMMQHAVLAGARLHGTLLKGAVLDGVSLLDVDFSVAVDMEPLYQVQLIHQARQLIAAERDVIMNDKVRLLQEENALQEVKARLEREIAHNVGMRASQDIITKVLMEYGHKFSALSWVWGAVLAGYLVMLGLMGRQFPLEDLPLVELCSVAGLMLGVMAAFMYTMVVCARAARLVNSRFMQSRTLEAGM